MARNNDRVTLTLAFLVAGLLGHAVWREAFPHRPREDRQGWIEQAADSASVLARTHGEELTGAALARFERRWAESLDVALGAAASVRERWQQRVHALEQRLAVTADSLRLAEEALATALDALALRWDGRLDTLGAGLRAEREQALAARQDELDALREAQARTLEGMEALIASLDAELRGLDSAFDAELEALAARWQDELSALRESLREAGRQPYEVAFTDIPAAIEPSLFRLILVENGAERVLGSAFCVRADGVLATSGSLALEALRSAFRAGGALFAEDADGRRLAVVRQRIAEAMEEGSAAADIALLKVDTAGAALPPLPPGAPPALAEPLAAIFPGAEALAFARGHVARSPTPDRPLRASGSWPGGAAGAPLFGPAGTVVAVASPCEADDGERAAAVAAVFVELLRDF